VIFKQKKVGTQEIFNLAQFNTWAWLKHKIVKKKLQF